MKELSLAQKAMLNGSVCPYCKIPSTIINTVGGKASWVREVWGLDEIRSFWEADGEAG